MSELFYFVVVCFAVGVFVLMLFTEEGRGCIGVAIGLLFIFVAIVALGGAVIFAALYVMSEIL